MFLDDFGSSHTFCIPNMYIAPDAPHRLFSPQLWRQTAFAENAQLEGLPHNMITLYSIETNTPTAKQFPLTAGQMWQNS